ncbi:MAG: hypothetical protein ABSF35_24095 [Polyangia bacterium]|jgi:hypothetical protein
MFKKDKPTPPTAMEIHLAVEKHVLMQSTWRQVTDEELPAALAALTEIIGKKTAAQPSMQRRLGIMRDGSAYVLALEIPADAIIGQPWHPSPNGPPQFTVCGFPIAKGVELLAGPLNPEAELTDRRQRYDQYLKGETAKRAAEAKAIADTQAQRLNEEVERQKCHAGEWALLNSLERFACRLALAVESRDAGLAADLRKLVADRLAGTDDDAEAWPRNPAWASGLGLEALSAERRQDLAMMAQGERENATMETIPRDRLPSLKVMTGNSRTGIIAQWRAFTRANRGAAGGKAA